MPFRIALSGLTAASSDLKVTGNNIANASTSGFKQSRTEFADVFAVSFGGTSSNASGNGVRVSTVSQQFTQGSIEFSDKALDLAISGAGFFVLSDSGGQSYSRAGSFHVDSSGNVVNNNGQSLQIFPVNISGGSVSTTTFNTGLLTDLTLGTTDGPPQATTNITAGLNFQASSTVPTTTTFSPIDPSSYTSTTSVIIYDSLGDDHKVTMYYAKTATPNEWNSWVYVDGNPINETATGVSPFALTFGTDGSIASPASGTVNYQPLTGATLTATSGTSTNIADLNLSFDYSNTTQFGNAFTVNTLSQNGFTSGRLSGIDIDPEGVVFARFTNGQSTALGKVALANFANPQGLRQLGNTAWAQTFDSGDLLLGLPGTGSLGLVQSGALEASNVDIASQLVNLITAQRSFQANAQVISTADTVTQTIINI